MRIASSVILCTAGLVLGFGESCTPSTSLGESSPKAEARVETVDTLNVDNHPRAADMAPRMSIGLQADKTPMLSFDPAVRKGVLPNGFTYYILPNARPTDRAELRLMVKAGSILEDEDQRGLAHFVEHMAFNGTEHYAENELIDYLQSTGARFGPDLNAYTSFDETVYLLQVRTDSAGLLDKGLGILRDWAQGITFADEEIDKERGVVLSEWRSGLGAQERLRNQTLPVVLAQSRYAKRLPIGDTTVLKRAPYDALKRFYRDWYRPDLMAVAIVGNIEPDAIEAEVKRLFGDLKSPGKPRLRELFDGPAYAKTQVVVASDAEASYTLVQLNYLLPKFKLQSEADARQDMVAMLYNQMLSSRFDEKSEDPDTPYSFANSGRRGLVGNVDSYSSFAVAKPGQVLASLTAVVEENQRVLQHGFTLSELERAKASLLNDLKTATREAATTPSSVYASGLVDAFLESAPFTNVATIQQLGEKFVPEIQLTEVNALAQEYLADRPMTAVITGSTNDELPDEATLLAAIKTAASRTTEPYAEQVTGKIEVPLLAPIAIKSQEVSTKHGVYLLVLANGVRIAYKQTDFAESEINFSALSKGGSNQFVNSDYPTADMVGGIGGAMGTGPFTPSELDRVLSGKTVALRARIGANEEFLSGTASPETLEDLMQLVYLHFQGAEYDEALGRAMIEQQRAFIENLAASPDFKFQAAVTEALYGKDNPRHQSASKAWLDAIDVQRGFALYQQRFADARDWQFNFVGDFNPDTLRALAQRYLGNLPTRGTAEQYRDPQDLLAKGDIDRRFRAGTAPKSNVLLLRAGPLAEGEHERWMFRTVVDVLNQELRERLREDLGGVYGVRVSGSTSVRPQREYTLQISYNADPPRVDELLAATQEVITRILTQGPEAKTLQIVRAAQYESLKSAMANSNGYWVGAMERMYTENYKIDRLDLEYMREVLDQFSASDVQAALRRYFEELAATKLQVVMDPE